MTSVELALQITVFGVALWLGLYLISRNFADRRLAWTAVILDVLWVAGSYVLLLASI